MYCWYYMIAVLLLLHYFLVSRVIDGKEYPADVKEKEVAKRIYQKAKDNGKTAAHVAAV